MKIAILGAGKIGGWLASELGKSHEVAVFDLDRHKAAGVQNALVIGSLSELGKFLPDLLINAVSLQHTVAAFKDVAPHLPKECIICDVTSIKGDLPKYYAISGFRFASVHPMFGPTFADFSSLKEENAIIIRESDDGTADFFKKFFSSYGIRIFQYTFSEHDEMMAYSLTTPFASTLVFASSIDKTVVPGATFARHLKIAKGLLSEDDSLLCEILFNKYSIPQLERITGRLELLKHIIKARDSEEAKRFLGKLRKNIG